jgi:D-alanyl-D-alanine carboxypeptidase
MPNYRARRIVSGLVALAVVLGTVYAAAALISPVPRLVVDERLPAAAAGSWSDEVPLPEDGASAIAVDGATPIAVQDAQPRPIAGAARLMLLAVALDAEPLSAGSPGPAITIDQEAVARYRELDALGVRTVPVTFGQIWTRRDLIAATLLGAGNNIAELLIDEVFGGMEAYRSAAATWLTAQGLTSTTVLDASGLDSATRSTAADLAVIAGRLLDQPAAAEIVEQRPLRSSAGVAYPDVAAVLPGLGTRGLVSTYTDPAGVCVVATLDVDGERAVVVLLGQPSFPRADEAVSAVVEGLRTAIRPVEVIAAGQVVAVTRSDWGQETELIALEPIVVSSTALDALELRVEPAVRSTIVRGADAGRLVATLPAAGDGNATGGNGTQIVVRLESTGAITEPGVAWRFADPFTVLGRWTG